MTKKQLRFALSPEIENMTIAEIEDYLEKLETLEESTFKQLLRDSRRGTTKLAKKHMKKQERVNREKRRIRRLKRREAKLNARGYEFIAGVDEAGRGALAGPVMAAAVIMPTGSFIAGINDSKKISSERRENLKKKIIDQALSVGVGKANVEEIDKIDIAEAIRLAMRRAIKALEPSPQIILIDGGIDIPALDISAENIKNGDEKVYSIAAASIVAKVSRDRVMDKLSRKFPEYNFDSNKGYGTEKHLKAVENNGYSSIHRSSFHFHSKNQLSLF